MVNSKQVLANLIQANEAIVTIARSGYEDEKIKNWLTRVSLDAQQRIKSVKEKLKDDFDVDYDSADAKKIIIKEGSNVEVIASHMEGMSGATGTVKSYSIPAMLSDLKMKDGMKMGDHKWLTNDEVRLK